MPITAKPWGIAALLTMLVLSYPAAGAPKETAPKTHFVQMMEEDDPIWLQRRPRRGSTIPGGTGLGGTGIHIPLIPIRPQWDVVEEEEPVIEERPTKRRKPRVQRPNRRPVAERAKPPRKAVVRRAAKPAVRQALPAPQPAAQLTRGLSAVPGEIVFRMKGGSAEARSLVERHGLTAVETSELGLVGGAVVRAKVAPHQSVEAILRLLRKDKRILLPQPNHLYTLEADGTLAALQDLSSTQYAPAKMRVKEAQALAGEGDLIIAVIDAAVDASHPELAGNVIDGSTKGSSHGTAIAGAIAAHARLVGVAPNAKILSIAAFSSEPPFGSTQGSPAQGSTFDIIRGLDRAAKAGARVINLSFAGPKDDLLGEALTAASERGIVLVAAAGNEGPDSVPLYPAAHPAVIAVTATDATDKLYDRASRGAHIAVAAPGVDILVPAPGSSYQQLSGTSLAAAHVSGVVGLILQRQPALKPSEVKLILTQTSQDLGPPGQDKLFGAGLVNALKAVVAAEPDDAAVAGARSILVTE